MAYTADIEYLEDLLGEFNLSPNQKISALMDALENADAEETDD